MRIAKLPKVLFFAVILILFAVPMFSHADCVNPPSGLVSWWGGDNNALDIVGTNNGTLNGATYAQGKVSQAFSFDGVDDYINVPYSASLDMQGSITISAWINSNNNSSANRLIAGRIGGWQFFVEAGGLLDFGFYNGIWTHLHSSIHIPENEWVHVAATFNATDGTMQLYINGDADTSLITAQRWTANSNPLMIGGFGGLGAPFSGRIDEVGIFNRALGAPEIAAIYNADSAGMCRPPVAPPSGLISWWKGENNASDQLGINNGTLVNGATFSQGKVGQAFSLNGTNQYIDVPNSTLWNFGSNNFSINFWVNFDGATSFFLGHDNGGYGNNKWIFYLSGGRLSFHINGPYSVEIGQFPYTFASGQWYHLAVTRSGSAYTIYVNGASLGTATDSRAIPDATASLTIGQSEGLYFVHGLMDEIGIFNRALNADEIASIYNAGSSGMSFTPDTTPDAFNFITQIGMPINTAIVSNPITVTGINSAAAISISGNSGEYSISTDSGSTWDSWTSTAGTVSLNNQVKVRLTSSASYSTPASATLTIGGVNGDFNVTTAASGEPNASGLVSWWKAENNAYDSVGGNHGTTQGGVAYASGQVGQAFNFDGVNDYVAIPHSDSLNFGANQPMSLNLWVKRTSTSAVNTILAKRPDCGGQVHYILQWYETGNWLHFGSTGGLDNGVHTTADKLPLNTWTNISVTFDGTTATLYINGSPVASNAMHFDPNTVPVTLGAEPVCGDFFGGLIDEVKIFNRALTALEVSTLASTKPDAFSFNAQTGVALSIPVESNAITVTGITNPAAISITGGEYSVSSDGGTWSTYSSTIPATVSLNDQVKVRLTSSGSYSTMLTATLTIGGVSGAFNVTTLPQPYLLTVTKDGTGSGTVTVNSGSLSWIGSTGTASYAPNTSVDIGASADPGSNFKGFTVDCISNTSPCTVTMSGPKSVIATFDSNADFTGNPQTGSVPHNVTFTDTSTHSPTTWSWTFGDGGTSTQKNPVHTYRADGLYTVALTATGIGGASTRTKPGYVTVSGLCGNYPYKIGGSTYNYGSIQAAYESPGTAGMVQIQALVFTGGLMLNQSKNLTLQGGYGCDFTTNPGDTIVSDKLTIKDGKVTIEKLTIK